MFSYICFPIWYKYELETFEKKKELKNRKLKISQIQKTSFVTTTEKKIQA